MEFKKYAVITLGLTQIISSSGAFAEETDIVNRLSNAGENFRRGWDVDNDPENIDPTYEKNFYRLPNSGKVAHFPWTSTYSPNYLGGAAWRARHDETPFNYRSPTKEEVQKMTQHELNALSPVEKYDIFQGRYDYPTVASELARTSPNDEEWSGLCHGWSPASINFSEPHNVVMRSAEGIEVPFSSHDIKVLLAYYHGEVDEEDTQFLGIRCEGGPLSFHHLSPDCKGVNPGAFHIVLTNEVGLRHKSFVFDRDPGYQVWNQPVVSYTTRIYKEKNGFGILPFGKARGTNRRIWVETKIVYTDELKDEDEMTWKELNRTKNYKTDEVVYRYRLEIDSYNRIIGGKWLSDMRPDFLWRQPRPKFEGYFSALETIYQASVAARNK